MNLQLLIIIGHMSTCYLTLHLLSSDQVQCGLVLVQCCTSYFVLYFKYSYSTYSGGPDVRCLDPYKSTILRLSVSFVGCTSKPKPGAFSAGDHLCPRQEQAQPKIHGKISKSFSSGESSINSYKFRLLCHSSKPPIGGIRRLRWLQRPYWPTESTPRTLNIVLRALRR